MTSLGVSNALSFASSIISDLTMICTSALGSKYISLYEYANLSTNTGVNGYVPSPPTGICVATTRNGFGSFNVFPSILTCPSCIASIRADCVLGGALLSSSTKSIFVNIGPSRKTHSLFLISK